MARIRTIKPEIAKHELLFELEMETGLPLRFAWAVLPSVCCREGRFKWRPRALKTDILPYDDVDFSRVLDAWLTRGFLLKYRVNGEWIGLIPTFKRHQSVNGKEPQSTLPDISEADEVEDYRNQDVANASPTREPHVRHASSTCPGSSRGEGKGREGISLEQKQQQQQQQQQQQKLQLNGSKLLFDRFWETYPRKRNKGQAEKVWAKLKPDPALTETILAAVARASESADWQRDDGRFIPYPSTWLNGKGWEDEHDPSPARRDPLDAYAS